MAVAPASGPVSVVPSGMVAPISGASPGLYRAQVTNSIREVGLVFISLPFYIFIFVIFFFGLDFDFLLCIMVLFLNYFIFIFPYKSQ